MSSVKRCAIEASAEICRSAIDQKYMFSDSICRERKANPANQPEKLFNLYNFFDSLNLEILVLELIYLM